MQFLYRIGNPSHRRPKQRQQPMSAIIVTLFGTRQLTDGGLAAPSRASRGGGGGRVAHPSPAEPSAHRACGEVADERIHPARRGEEVTADVIDGPRSAVWRQAENRMHSARGAMAWMMGIRPL